MRDQTTESIYTLCLKGRYVYKFFVFKNKTNLKEYSVRLIEHLLRDNIVIDPSQADYVLVSLCDISEVGDITKAKALGRPVISGGMVSEYPIVNELSDYVWHGEIYDFADNVKNGVKLHEMDCITTKNNRKLKISQRINWAVNPIIKVGGRAMYYYVSKGCPVRCKYCYIGNVRDYQFVPKMRYEIALDRAGRNLMPIAAYNPYGVPGGSNIGETLLKKYIEGFCGKSPKMIRSGVEFVTDRLSAGLAKGVTIDHFCEAIKRSKSEGTKLILYFIAGLETQESIELFFSKLPIDYITTPVVNIVFTYIDPQPFTPMQDYDLRQKITDIDSKRIYAVANAVNKRIRVLPLSAPTKSIKRTLLGRCCGVDDYKFIGGIKNLNHDEMIDKCSIYDGGRLLGEKSIEEIIKMPREALHPDYWEV